MHEKITRIMIAISPAILFASLQVCGQNVFKEQLDFQTGAVPGKMIELPGGDVVLQGQIFLPSGYNLEFFSRIDALGNIVWTRQFADSANWVHWNYLMFVDSTGIIHSIGNKCTDLDMNGNIVNRKSLSYGMLAARRSGNGYKVASNGFIYDMDSAYNPSATAKRISISSYQPVQYRDYGFIRTSDQGFVYYGRCTKTSSQTSESKFYFVKFDSLTQLQWYKIYKSANPADSVFSVSDLIQTSTGDYMAAFTSDLPWNHVYTLKLDSSGNVRSGRRIPVPYQSLYFHVTEDPATGNYLFAMNMQPGLISSRTAGVLKTDTALTILSSSYYTDSVSNYYAEQFSEILPLSNGQFILKTPKFYGVPQRLGIFLMKTDSAFLTGCNDTPISYTDSAFEVVPAADTLTVTTINNVTTSSLADTVWVSNYSLTVFCQTVGITQVEDGNSFQVFPNPFSHSISIDFQNRDLQHADVSVRNIFGQTVYSNQLYLPDRSGAAALDLGFLASGFYLLEIISDGKRTVKKIVKD